MVAKGGKGLLKFVESVAGKEYLKVEKDLGAGFFRLKLEELERRQAKHDIKKVEDVVVELLRNSRDASSSKIFITSSKENSFRKLVVIDDGCGIPSYLKEKIFEPRVTSRLERPLFDRYGLHGRGMALFSVKEQAEQAWVISSFPNEGSVFKVEMNLRKLPEKKDQSTFPTPKRQGKFFEIARGPHNILRVATEFNLNHPELVIYIGSPAEILATMRSLGAEGSLKKKEKIWSRVAEATSAKALLEIARRYFELEISLRNAHRLLKGEIEPLLPLLDLITKFFPKKIPQETPENLARLISAEDLARISQSVSGSLQPILKRYYLGLTGFPQVFKEKNRLKIFLELGKEDEV